MDAARTAELRPLGDERAVLVEDLETAVAAVAHEDPALRIDGDRMRLVELARCLAGVLHDLMNLPSLENFTTRLLVPWPSVTKISPVRATATSVG